MKFIFSVYQKETYSTMMTIEADDLEKARDQLERDLDELPLEQMKNTYDGLETTIEYEEEISNKINKKD